MHERKCGEKVNMRTFIDEKAPKTQEYARYIFETLIKQAPLTKGANVEIDIIENVTPFPKLVEMPEGFPDTARMSKELSNWKVRHPGRFGLLYEYTTGLLDSMCTPLTPSLQPEIRINMVFNYVIDDPEKIYREAQKLGIKIPREVIANEQDTAAPATFTEQPPQIRWLGALIPIPWDSKQLCVCRVMFSKKVGEIVSWDEIANDIDGTKEHEHKTGQRSVYDAVLEVNAKIETICGEKLFKTARKSFSRMA